MVVGCSKMASFRGVAVLCLCAGASKVDELHAFDAVYKSLRWRPEREQRSLGVVRHDDDWRGALEAELKRSLRSFPRVASGSEAGKVLRSHLEKPELRDKAVLVLGGRLFSSAEFAAVAKNKMHLRMLAAVSRRSGTLKNVAMVHHSASDGACARSGRRAVPTTVIAKKAGYAQCGVLVPNPYFGRGDTADEWPWAIAELRGRAAKWPHAKRAPRAFWRGTLGHHADAGPCDRDSGNYDRFRAMTLTATFPKAFDIKCHRCAPWNASAPCAGGVHDATMAALAADPSPIFDAKWYEPKAYARFKYVVNLPGETAGSYSRNLNHLWAVGSGVMLWDAAFVEWYYPALRHGETHVAINATTAKQVHDYLEDPASGRRLAKLLDGARRVQDDLVSPFAIATYVAAVVDALRGHMRFDLVLDDENATARWLGGVDCSGLVETTVWPHRGSRDHWVDNRVRPLATCDDLIDAVRDSQGRGTGGAHAYGTALPG